MEEKDLMPVSKDLGLVTAYGYAKEGGFEGTEEEFDYAMAMIPEAFRRLGKPDFSTTLNSVKLKIGEVGPNQTLSFDFVNHSDRQSNSNNFVLIFGSNQYFRPDNYSWGSLTVSDSDNNWNMDRFRRDIDGARVHAEIENHEGIVKVRFDVVTKEGSYRYQWYELAQTINEVKSVVLTVDHSYADVFTDLIRLYDNSKSGGNSNTTVIGKEDFSSVWTDEDLMVKVGEVGYNTTLSFDFVNHSRKQENWDNFILIFNDNTYFRPDNYSWGNYTVGPSGNNWDFGTLKSDMDGALVHAEVINWQGTVRIMFTITTVEGVFHYQWYDLSDYLSNSVYSVALTVDHAYVDLYLDSIRVYETVEMLAQPFRHNDGVLYGPVFRSQVNLLNGDLQNGFASRCFGNVLVITQITNGVYRDLFTITPTSLYFNGTNSEAGMVAYLGAAIDYGYLLLNGKGANIILDGVPITRDRLIQAYALVTRVGNFDFSSTLGEWWYREIEVPHESGDLLCQGVGIKFRNYSDKAENWHNATVRLSLKSSNYRNNNAIDIHKYTGAIYLRMDDFAFRGGESQEGFDYTVEKGNNWNWTTFKDDLDGALCEVFVQNRYVDGSSRNNYKIRVDFKVLTTAGKVYRQWYVVTVSSGFIESAKFNLTVDNAYIDVDNNSFTVLDYPSSIQITVPNLPYGMPGLVIP